MKKRLNGKLSLSKETLRTLAVRNLDGVQGGNTAFCTTGGSNITDTCETCVGPSCRMACPSDDTTC